ncbi:MAG TPA: alpha-hydroxy acid oxidase [Candidatus Binataceae bacterium]|nr:alpha-hydroxy acid oxidase [Candidatus Binataceae bacterium]
MSSPIKRRMPRFSELAQWLKPQPFNFNIVERRLSRAVCVADMRLAARKRAPRQVFDYVDGGADEEILLRRQYDAWDRVEFNPRVLRDVSNVDTTTSILGHSAALPLALAPTGFTRLSHTEGESAAARAAKQAGIPYALSTMGSTSIEDIAAAGAGGTLWFQLYVWKDRRLSEQLLQRAQAAGYKAVLLTVDTAVIGRRARDLRNGFTIPPAPSLDTLIQGLRHPAWSYDFLTTEPPSFAAFKGSPAPLETIARIFDASVTWNDIKWVREFWKGPLLLKGVTRLDQAKQAVDEYGVNGIILSTHGGRQLDRQSLPLEVLPSVVDAVGDRAEILIDGGVMNGGDIVAAVAFGARAVLIGRAFLYGLMAGGERGVKRVLDILKDETVRAMQLLGAKTVSELDRSLVRLRPR